MSCARCSSPKKARTPQRRSLALHAAIAEIAAEYERMSVRQLFYQLVSRGVVDKTENAYKRTCDAAVQMRLAGTLDYRKITDGHRQRRTLLMHRGLQHALESAHDFYRRDYWREQPRHIEVWCEKDALSGVIQPVCDAYGVPYVATRGFPSVTLRYESAQAIRHARKPASIFYFGDHDASGHSISECVASLRDFGADVTVERVALNPDQVDAHHLPTRPGKQSDSRHAGFVARFGDAAVELDALPPDVLIALVEERILSAIDHVVWHGVMEQERLERVTLKSIAIAGWQSGHRYSVPSLEGVA